MSKIHALLIAALILSSAHLHAAEPARDPVAPMSTWLRAFSDAGAQQCMQFVPNAAREASRLDQAGRRFDAHMYRVTIRSLCDCHTREIFRRVQAVGDAGRSELITGAEFEQRYARPAFGTCAAASLQDMYGPGCEAALAADQKFPRGYCGCMKKGIGKLSPDEAIQLGTQGADWITAAASARREGALPPPPPLLQRVMGVHGRCAG